MKKTKLILAILIALSFTACSNGQRTSAPEAKYLVEHLPDFQELVQYASVQIIGIFPGRPTIYESDPVLGDKGAKFIHQIIYRTKSGSFKLLFINDQRPPVIIATKEFK